MTSLLLLVTLALTCLVLFSSSGCGARGQTNLLANGDFETAITAVGNGWSTPQGVYDSGLGSTGVALRIDGSPNFTGPSYYSYHGEYALLFESGYSNLSVTQQVPVTGGHQYIFSFFLQFNDADQYAYFQASYQHNTDPTQTVLLTPASFTRGSAASQPPMWWSQFTYTIVSPSVATALNITFSGSDPDWGFQIDFATLYDAGVSGLPPTVSAPPPPPALLPDPSNNLLVNGDFESGSVAPWRANTDNPYNLTQGEGAYDYNHYFAHGGCPQGVFCYSFGFPYYSLPIWQTVTGIQSTQNYTFSFEWSTPGGYPRSSADVGSLLAFSAAWGSNTLTRYWSVVNSTNATASNVTIQLGVPPSYTTTLWIQFDGFSYASHYLLDFTVLTAAPTSSAYTPPASGTTNLLANGDFETAITAVGNGWSTPQGVYDSGLGSTGVALRIDGSPNFTGPSYYSYHGEYALLFESGYSNLSVTQQVPVTGGHQYIFSFFLQFNDADQYAYFQASYQHNTDPTQTVLLTPASFTRGSAASQPPMWWSQFTYTIVSPSVATALNITFSGSDPDWGFQIDFATLYDAGVSGLPPTVSAPPPPPALLPDPSNNLLVNGDFESGSVAPWRANTDNPYNLTQGEGAYDYNHYFAHGGCPQGVFCYSFGFPYYSLPIWQTVTGIQSTQNYTFSFEWSTPGGYPRSSADVGSLLAFSAAWGSNTLTRYWSVVNSTNATASNVTIQLGVPPSYTTTLWIQFDGFSYASHYLLDFTVLTAAPTSSAYTPPASGTTNLLANGDFETAITAVGNGWSTPQGVYDSGLGSTGVALRIDGSPNFTGPSYYSYHGEYALLFESGYSNLSVTQQVPVTGGHQYIFSFFLQFNDADQYAYFQASYQHNTDPTQTVLLTPASFTRGSAASQPPMWWSQFTYTIVSPSVATALNITFSGSDPDWGFQIDFATLYDAGVSGLPPTVSAPPPPPALLPDPSNNLLVNGDFESGSVAPWRANTDNPYNLTQGEGAYDYNHYFAHGGCPQGVFCYSFGFPYYSLPIWQTVTGIQSTQNYTFSFEWSTPGGYPRSSADVGSLLAFSAAWGSNTLTRYWSVVNSTNATASNVTIQLGVPPSYTTTLWIQFDGFSYASHYLLDFTVLTAAPTSSAYTPPASGTTNLLANGDFETAITAVGNGWSTPQGVYDSGLGSTGVALRIDGSPNFTGPSYYSYHGEYALLFESGYSNLSVTQQVPVTGGHQYIFSFFLQFNDADQYAYFQASYQHNTDPTQTVLLTPASFTRGSAASQPPMWWSQFTYTIVSPSVATALNITFSGSDPDWGFQIDFATLYDAGVSGLPPTVSAPPPPPALLPDPSNNLLVNGDFESGSVAPWRANTDNPYNLTQGEGAYDYNHYFAHGGCPQGVFCYSFGFPYYSLPIWQTVTGIQSTQNYTFSFEWSTPGGYPRSSADVGSLLAFSAAWGSNTLTRYWSVVNSTNATASNVTIQLGVPPSYTTTLWIQFDGFSYASHYLLDFTVLTAVPVNASASTAAASSSSSSTSSLSSRSAISSSAARPVSPSAQAAYTSSSSTQAAYTSSTAAGASAGAVASSSSSSSLSGGAISGIVIGSVVGAFLLCLAAVFLVGASRKRSNGGEAPLKPPARTKLGETSSVGSSRIENSRIENTEEIELQ